MAGSERPTSLVVLLFLVDLRLEFTVSAVEVIRGRRQGCAYIFVSARAEAGLMRCLRARGCACRGCGRELFVGVRVEVRTAHGPHCSSALLSPAPCMQASSPLTPPAASAVASTPPSCRFGRRPELKICGPVRGRVPQRVPKTKRARPTRCTDPCMHDGLVDLEI